MIDKIIIIIICYSHISNIGFDILNYLNLLSLHVQFYYLT